MSTQDKNKHVIKKAKELLAEYGHQVKTSHLYEIFAKLSGHKNWNVASSKNVDFNPSSLMNDINGGIKTQTENYVLDSFSNESLKEKLFLGKKANTCEPIIRDLSNSAYIGSMGTGKSSAAFSTLLLWALSNGNKSIIFVSDPRHGADDYSPLFETDENGKRLYEQIFPVFSFEKIIRLIELLHEEVNARQAKFEEVGAKNIFDFEKKAGKKISRIIYFMEEFHNFGLIPGFWDGFFINNTPANKFFHLLRTGRSMGIVFSAISQRSTATDIPPELLASFENIHVFKTSFAESSYVLGNVEAAKITGAQIGRCETNNGAVQFDYINKESARQLLKRKMKPLKSECFFINKETIKQFLGF